MGRGAVDGAGAIFHQNEIGDIDRNPAGRVERVDRLDTGVEAQLFRLFDQRLGGAAALALGDEGGERRVLRRRSGGERVVRRHGHELHAEDGVVASGEDFELGFAVGRGGGIEREADVQAFRAPDPVALHQPNLLRPAIEPVERGEKVFGKIRDLEEPLSQLALLDQRAGAPATPVDDLLVGEHGVVDRVPVHLGLLALDQAGGEEVEKHLLLVLVVGGIAGRDLAAPVQRQAHRLELPLHGGDVLVGPGARMDLVGHGRVFGRHAEGVPAHGVKHVEPAGALVARHHVPHGVVAHMAHVDAPGGVREHLEHVVFCARVVVAGCEHAPLVPYALPAGFRCAGVISLDTHDNCLLLRRRKTTGLGHHCGAAVNRTRRFRCQVVRPPQAPYPLPVEILLKQADRPDYDRSLRPSMIRPPALRRCASRSPAPAARRGVVPRT